MAWLVNIFQEKNKFKLDAYFYFVSLNSTARFFSQHLFIFLSFSTLLTKFKVNIFTYINKQILICFPSKMLTLFSGGPSFIYWSC